MKTPRNPPSHEAPEPVVDVGMENTVSPVESGLEFVPSAGKKESDDGSEQDEQHDKGHGDLEPGNKIWR